jgi:hypothetical protein
MSFATDLATWLANVHTEVTTKSAVNSITPANVGGDAPTLHGIEGAGNLMAQLAALIISAGDLNTVLTTGNTSPLSILLDDGTYKIVYAKDSIAFFKSGTLVGQILTDFASSFNVSFKDPSSANFGFIRSGALTASRVYLLPNEGGGTGVDSTLVIHTTNQPVTVYNTSPSTYFAEHAYNHFVVGDNANNFAGIEVVAGLPKLYLVDGVTGFQGAIILGPLAADRNYTLPDKSGTFAMLSDITNGVVANGDRLARTGSVVGLTTYTTPNTVDGTYSIGGYINVTAYTSGTVDLNVDWTDVNGTPQTFLLTGWNSTGFIPAATRNIRVKKNTAITISTTVGTATYDVGGTITFIAN